MQTPIDYLNPNLSAGLPRVSMPVIDASTESLQGYGYLIDNPADCKLEIVRWPSTAGNINVQEMENIVFEGSHAAVARINLDSPPDDTMLARLSANTPHILEINLLEL